MIAHQRERTRGSAFPAHLWDQPVQDDQPPSRPGVTTELSVLASSSSGNCSILMRGEGRRRRLTLIDAGISPLRTRKMLASWGLELEQIDDVLFTHLDTDHCHAGWVKGLPRHARFRVYAGHRGRARRARLTKRRTYVFGDAPFDMADGVRVHPVRLDHDDLGVVAFRFEFDEQATLGYATDLGRATDDLLRKLAGVDVLAIESNYCPRMQMESDRPEFLKRRIMNGAGHLSNEECRVAVRAIEPRNDVVLLHLSKQCNTPELAARLHLDEPYRLTIASPSMPTPLLRILDGQPDVSPDAKTTGNPPVVSCEAVSVSAGTTTAPRSIT
ncbi:MAG: MBL fold metallo-hydrolase [Planctomycetota bacterium]